MNEDFPDGWCGAELSELVIDGPTNGYSPVSAADATGTLTLKLGATTTGVLKLGPGTIKRIHEVIPVDSKFWLHPGDVLIQRANSLEYVGATAIFDGPVATYIYPDLMMRVRVGAAIQGEYLWRYLNTTPARRFFRDRATGTAGNMPKINGTTVRSAPIPLAPLAEQRRIVAKLEDLTAKSRRAKEALDAIPPLLERFRQSVLASAFRGDLTTEWRAKNPDVEPADKLLQRIRTERRRRWEESELAKMQAKGKTPGDDRWKQKYEEPEPVETEGLAELPKGWTWASASEVTLNFDGERIPLKLEDRDKRAGEYPYYGASGPIDTIDAYLFDGEFLLIAEDGANLLSRSTPIAFSATGRFWVNNHAHVVKPVVLPIIFVMEYLNGTDLASYVTGTAQPKLTQKNLNRIPIPVAPDMEAVEICRLVEGSERRRTKVLAGHDEMIAHLSNLNRSILAKAFRGELVPQDPTDEPASVLLDRIRRERAAAELTKAKKPPKRPL